MRRCNQESRDHGIETTVDDETFGNFSVGSTMQKRNVAGGETMSSLNFLPIPVADTGKRGKLTFLFVGNI